MTSTHTAHCIKMARVSIDENNLDTLADSGLAERTRGLDWRAATQLIDAELEAGYAEGALRRPTEAAAIEWLAEGNVTCADEDRCRVDDHA